MLTEELKASLNSTDNPCYGISRDLIIRYINPAAVSFSPKAVPETEFTRALCGRTSPCKACPLLGTLNTSKTYVPNDALCAFANVSFQLADDDNMLIISSWNGSKDTIDSIAELNTEKAIESLGGSREAYENVLEVYYKEGESKSRLILDYYNNSDFINLRIEIHGLKGTSYVIGADHLGDFAKKLEFACRDIEAAQDDASVAAARKLLDNELNNLIAEYNGLLQKLSHIFGPYEDIGENTPVPEIPLNEDILGHLNKALELMESFELEDAKNHLELADEELESDDAKYYLTGIIKLLDDFNYEEASRSLKKWIIQ